MTPVILAYHDPIRPTEHLGPGDAPVLESMRLDLGAGPVERWPGSTQNSSMTTPLRLGIIGTGFIADVIAHALQGTTEVTLNAVASRRVETDSAFALRHGSVPVFESW